MTPEDLLTKLEHALKSQGDASSMPDIAGERLAPNSGTLDRVGMDAIEVLVKYADGGGGTIVSPGRATAYLSLDDPHAKGIHMSRLYLHVQKSLEAQPIGFASVEKLLRNFINSHGSLSKSAHFRVSFEFLTKRRSLLSNHEGYRAYPVFFEGTLAGQELTLSLGVRIAYSSTCPCSAALARQLIQEKFREDFKDSDDLDIDRVARWLGTESGIVATPHSQRSYADIEVRVGNAEHSLQVLDLVNRVEDVLATAVQATVKREDEQEFAKLNGQNLMFCEDAARRMKAAIDPMDGITDYRICARHIESLHPHDAVSIVTKGIPGGLRP